MQDLLPLIQTGGLIALLALGFVMGKLAERRHYRSIREREPEFVGIPTVSLGTLSDPRPVAEVALATGSVVISAGLYVVRPEWTNELVLQERLFAG